MRQTTTAEVRPDGGKSSEFRRRDDLLLAILAAKGSAGRSANFDARQF
jgi:hypothetical protein